MIYLFELVALDPETGDRVGSVLKTGQDGQGRLIVIPHGGRAYLMDSEAAGCSIGAAVEASRVAAKLARPLAREMVASAMRLAGEPVDEIGGSEVSSS